MSYAPPPILGTPGSSQATAQALPPLADKDQHICWGIIGVLSAIVIVAYLDTLGRISGSWRSGQYAHGYLIPLFAAGLLYLRRKPFSSVPQWERWVGVGIFSFGIMLRVMGAKYVTFFAENLSIVPSLLGVFVIVGGLPTLRWAGPPIGFLAFMIPLPRQAEELFLHRMQHWATMGSQFTLVTLGVDSHREGNKIFLASREEAMNVAEQCSGLRMLSIFVALAVAMALIFSDKTWWERIIIVLSSVPIALGVNMFRITLTGLLYNFNASDAFVDTIFHDAAGWIMMPMALGLLYFEIHLLDRIFVDAPTEAMPISMGSMPASASAKLQPPR